jgi:hypothetical protein
VRPHAGSAATSSIGGDAGTKTRAWKATPRLNGKVERSHRIDAEEFYRLLDGVVENDSGLFNLSPASISHTAGYARTGTRRGTRCSQRSDSRRWV